MGQPCHITKERVEALDELGFVWQPRDRGGYVVSGSRLDKYEEEDDDDDDDDENAEDEDEDDDQDTVADDDDGGEEHSGTMPAPPEDDEEDLSPRSRKRTRISRV